MQEVATTAGLSPPTAELDTLLANRARAADLLQQGIAMIAEAAELTPGVGGGRSSISMLSALRNASWLSADTPQGCEALAQKALASFDTNAWHWLLDASQMTQVLSSKDKEAYQRQLSKGPPPLTRESVVGTFTELFSNRQATWRRGVVELFQRLSGSYKSHDAFKIGKRLIISGAFDAGGWRPFSGARDHIDDLERIICVIQGDDVPEPSRRWSMQIDDARRQRCEHLVDRDVLFRWHKNGNIHVWIQEPGLIDQINDIIAEHYGAAIMIGIYAFRRR